MANESGGTKNGRIMPNTSLPDFHLQVSRNQVHKVRNTEVFGRNTAIAQVIETLWEAGGNPVFPTVAAKISITSSSTSDTYNGVGARNVYIDGLDNNYNRLQETVTLSGTSAVLSSNNFIRVNKIIANDVGTTGYNVGNIVGTIGGNTQFYIVAEEGISANGIYTVPAGSTAYLKHVRFTVGKDKQMGCFVYYKIPGKSRLRISRDQIYQNSVDTEYQYAPVLPEKTDIWMAGKAGAGDHTVSGRLALIIIDDSPHYSETQ